MNEQAKKELGTTLWSIADQLRGSMNADDFRDYMLSFLFLRYLSDNYEIAAKKELGPDYPDNTGDPNTPPLTLWYASNPDDHKQFEDQMRRKVHYVIEPKHLWSSIAELARTQHYDLLHRLEDGFRYIENESFESTFQGLFSEINLSSEKLGRSYSDRNTKLCTIISKIAEGIAKFSTSSDVLGDAYEYLIGQFAAGSGKKAASSIPHNKSLASFRKSSPSIARTRPPVRKSAWKKCWTLPAARVPCCSMSAKSWAPTALARFTARKAISPPTTWRG